MKRGLVLGKFAPLHRGHQSLIEAALLEMDETFVLVYDAPEVTQIPLTTRAQWIRTLYPRVNVIEGHGSPTASGHDPAIMRLQEDYIMQMVPRPITHFFSSEWYGAHVSKALGAEDIRVDPSRSHFPISGTQLRDSPFEYREFVAASVYVDLIRWVVLLGAESTGKSTLTQELAKAYNTACMPEFGREFWERNHAPDGTLTPIQLVELACEHRSREFAAAQNANRLLFIDTDARTHSSVCTLVSQWLR